ncbi:MAG: AAA family ATPase [Acidobacteriia bacterium]|nr:AAA family ATPase [Terriglobia bacterium]
MSKPHQDLRYAELDPELRSELVRDFEDKLQHRIVGQERAVHRMSSLFQLYESGLTTPGRPIGNLLFLGPTGSGKTRLVEATAEVLYGSDRSFIKIDCGEFQHSHEIAKLVGSPPGYLGHRETQPALTQEAIDQFHSDRVKMTLLLFDEIEKASDSLWKLMLGVLDKATLTLGDNRRVDFSHCIIIMTSNLGGGEINRMMMGTGLGFASAQKKYDSDETGLTVYRTALDSAKRKFSPEFMNRIDKVIVFRPLRPEDLDRILDLELERVQQRILNSATERKFVFHCSGAAREFLLENGTDPQYGARPLKRAIERHIVLPLANLAATHQISLGDCIQVDYRANSNRLVFLKLHEGAVIHAEMANVEETPAPQIQEEVPAAKEAECEEEPGVSPCTKYRVQ